MLKTNLRQGKTSCDIANKNLIQFAFLHSYCSMEEQMVPCSSKDSSKKTIGTKTIRFEYNKFVVCSDDDYPNFIDSYCGAKYGGGEASKNPASHLLTNFIVVIDNWRSNFDNWFTSFSLVSVLQEQWIIYQPVLFEQAILKKT